MADERKPPTKIRVTGLQEAQLHALGRIEQACALMHHEEGLGPDQFQPRSQGTIGGMFRSHDLFVAEADHEVAGYLAWRDEQPKVGCIVTLKVDPEVQRFGVATRLLRELGDNASSHGIGHVVARCWKKAPWAVRFMDAMGFQPVAGELPKPIADWRDRLQKRGELAKPGQEVYWRVVEDLGVKIIPGIPRPS